MPHAVTLLPLLALLAAPPTPPDAAGLLARAVTQFDEGDFEAAARTLDQGLKAAPEPSIGARLRLYQGLLLASTGKELPADVRFTEALRLDPLVEPDAARVKGRLVERFRAVRARLTGVLEARSRPGARVFLDGQELGPAPLRQAVGVGRHVVEARGEGSARSAPATVVVGPDRVTVVDLEVQAAEGTLRLTSVPPGAEVRVDGRPAGLTPATLALPAGEHQVAMLSGEAEWRETVLVVEGRESVRHAVLAVSQAAAPKPAPADPIFVERERTAPPQVVTTPSSSSSGGGVRTAGFVLIGVGAVGGIGAALCGVLGKNQDGVIRTGGLKTARDIRDAEQLGLAFNTAAYVAGAVGAVALGTGIVLALVGGPSSPPVAVVPLEQGAAVVFSGRLP